MENNNNNKIKLNSKFLKYVEAPMPGMVKCGIF